MTTAAWPQKHPAHVSPQRVMPTSQPATRAAAEHLAPAADWQGHRPQTQIPMVVHPTASMCPPPLGSTAAARLRVRELGRQVTDGFGFWGRNWVKLTAPTLLGLAIGIPLRRRAAARAAHALAPQLAELRELQATVERVPAAKRSKGQRALLRDINKKIAILEPTSEVVTKEALRGIAAFTLGLVVSAVILSLAVGICVAANDGEVLCHGFFVPYGAIAIGDFDFRRSPQKPYIKILPGDELPLVEPLPGHYQQPKNSKAYRWA